MLQDIPFELRQIAQWVCAGDDKVPIHALTGNVASPTDPSTWCTFDQAVEAGFKHIGFVLTSYDPYCIIDLDNKPSKPLSQEEWQVHERILQAFNTYTEKSASGNGYHIVVKASIPKGRRRGNVEVYSNERYMIFTGNVVRNTPIIEAQLLIDQLINEMPYVSEELELVQVDSNIPDNRVVEKASNASNGDKFDKLCNGDWQNDYPSQSEADFALMSILCFYSKDNVQCRRIFRMTALGKRDKAKRDSYLNYAISKIRGNEKESLVDLSMLLEKAKKLSESTEQPEIEQQEQYDEPLATPPQFNKKEKNKLTPPPGLIGEMSDYFYATSIRPVKEISILAALALTAGVVGRAFNISGSGLNQYLILLARTGSGKEGAAKAIEHLISATRPLVPTVDQFIGPAAFSSGQALIKTLDTKPSFVSILGEFGLTLQQVSDSRATSSEKMLKKVLLDLYGKSGHNSTLRSSVYSDSDKNTKAVSAPNVTILGESTPDTFFESLDQSHIAEGLIPRFSIIEYNGDRPNRNRNSNHPPTENLVQKFASLVAISLNLQNKNACIPVQLNPEATVILDTFDTESDRLINNARNDVEMQLWNRAHLKALKLSALVAVGNNPHQPIVTQEVAEWAINFVKLDINTISSRFSDGDVGLGDNKQLYDMKQIITQYLTLSKELIKNYQIPVKLHAKGVIPFSYISRRCTPLAAFRKDRAGSRRAVNETVKFLVEQGFIVEIPMAQIESEFNVRARCYGIGDIV